uniref:60S ribosomal protein L13 n=1 Tax=Lygus hesperus TaxID=30085 RepID=A0A0A9Z7P4_LYGHE
MRIRAGRGFTVEELIAAGVNPKRAYGLRISVDKRRKDHSEEAFQANVQRLQNYMSRVVLLQKNTGSENLRDMLASGKAKQVVAKQAIPIVRKRTVIEEPREITEEERNAMPAYQLLRRAHLLGTRWNRMNKREARKEKQRATSSKKAVKVDRSDD